MGELDRLLDDIRPGMRVYIPGASGEPSALLAAWAADRARTAGLDIFTSMVPGINRFDPASLHPTARLSGLFMQPLLAESQRTGQYRHLPLSYAGFVRDLARLPPFDIAVVQVSPPDDDGQCSLGPSVELTTAIAAHAHMLIGIVNARTPRLPGAPTIPLSRFATWAETDSPLITYETGAPGPEAIAIARHIAPFIENGAALQVGIGKVPAALMAALVDRRDLRLRSGMFGEGVRTLAEAGALRDGHDHLATVFVGPQSLYDWAANRPDLRLAGCEHTHDPADLAAVDGLIAVNSALEADLFGQCNLETASASSVSAAGGAPDFARAAKTSRSGLSIIALPATAARGTASRIVGQMGNPGIVTIPRNDVDLVVTEHGVADLRGKSVHERAHALIAIAAPSFQADLATTWGAIARAL